MRLSNEFVNKLVTAAEAPKGHADPQLLLNYRCYLPGVSPRAEVWKTGRLLALLPAGCVTVSRAGGLPALLAAGCFTLCCVMQTKDCLH